MEALGDRSRSKSPRARSCTSQIGHRFTGSTGVDSPRGAVILTRIEPSLSWAVARSTFVASSPWTLEIRFQSGTVYHYFTVQPGIYHDVLEASSCGQCFNEHIRDRFPSQQTESAHPPAQSTKPVSHL